MVPLFPPGCSTGLHFFEKVKDLPTTGAEDVEHFTINESVFLAFATFLNTRQPPWCTSWKNKL